MFRTLAESMLLQETGTGRSSGGSTGGGSTIPADPDEGLILLTPEEKAIRDALQKIAKAIPPGWIQIDATHFLNPANGRVNELRGTSTGAITWDEYPAKESAAFLNSVGASGGAASGGGSAGGGASGPSQAELDLAYAKLSQDDKQFVQTLQAQLMNTGLDADAARQQVLGSLIINRNNGAVDIAETSANVAKTLAEFVANPRDAVAELMYRNQVGGSTPFGDLTNNNFGEYGKALADKAASIFQPVGQDLAQARVYRDSIPPVEFFGPETRAQLGLQPTAAQALAGGGGGAVTSPAAQAPTNGLQALMDRLNQMSPEEQNAFQRFTTIGSGHGWLAPPPIAPAVQAPAVNPLQGKLPKFSGGGSVNALDFEGMFANRDKPGFSPPSSEGGTNINIHERAIIVGESGQIYGTLGEKRPDGSIRAEQLQIKPLKSEVDKDKRLEEGQKAVVESQKKTLAAFAGGGTVNATPDDFMEQLSTYLGNLGGAGGGTGGFSTALPSPRLLAGAPYEQLLQDPDAMAYTQAGFSALGISPNNLAATIKRYQPNAPINNAPRVSWLG